MVSGQYFFGSLDGLIQPSHAHVGLPHIVKCLWIGRIDLKGLSTRRKTSPCIPLLKGHHLKSCRFPPDLGTPQSTPGTGSWLLQNQFPSAPGINRPGVEANSHPEFRDCIIHIPLDRVGIGQIEVGFGVIGNLVNGFIVGFNVVRIRRGWDMWPLRREAFLLPVRNRMISNTPFISLPLHLLPGGL